jgi:hypothetical protein
MVQELIANSFASNWMVDIVPCSLSSYSVNDLNQPISGITFRGQRDNCAGDCHIWCALAQLGYRAREPPEQCRIAIALPFNTVQVFLLA